MPKHHLRVEAYGSIDELIAWIGLLRDHNENETRKEKLLYIQDQLMRCAAIVATENPDPEKNRFFPDNNCVTFLEHEIDRMDEIIPPLRNFVLPGGHKLVSYCHIARCVCRRAERVLLRLNQTEDIPEIVKKYINRLSDYLFVLSRFICFELDIEDVKWSV